MLFASRRVVSGSMPKHASETSNIQPRFTRCAHKKMEKIAWSVLAWCSIPVSVAFEGSIDLDTDVIGLLLTWNCHLGTQCWEVQACYLLIQVLWQQVDLVFVALVFLPVCEKVELAKDLIREGAGHHKRWVTSGASQVQQTSRRQHNDAMAVREHEAVHLRFDILYLDAWKLLKLVHFNFIVEVADVANTGVVLHLLHVLKSDDREVTRSGREDINLSNDRLQGNDLKTLHASLQGADRIDLGNQNARTSSSHRKGAALANIPVATDECALATNHHVSSAHNAIRKRVSATIYVVELGLSHAVIHVDGWEKQFAFCHFF